MDPSSSTSAPAFPWLRRRGGGIEVLLEAPAILGQLEESVARLVQAPSATTGNYRSPSIFEDDLTALTESRMNFNEGEDLTMTMQFLSQTIDAYPSNAPLWLILERGDSRQYFEFPPKIDQAIVVGSASDAHVRLERTAPVVFYLERDGRALWLTPGYADSGLRVDSQQVTIRQEIGAHAQIEFADVRIGLRIQEIPAIGHNAADQRGAIRASSPTSSAANSRSSIGHVPTSDTDASDGTTSVPQPATAERTPILVHGSLLSTQTLETGPIDFGTSQDLPDPLRPRSGSTQPFEPCDRPLVGMPIIEIVQ